MSQLVLLAHTPAMSRSARAIAAELRRLGYTITPITPPLGGRRTLERRLADCRRLLVVCSRRDGAASALRGLTARAQAAAKLVMLQVDPGLRARRGFARPGPRGKQRARQWRRLIEGEGAARARFAGASAARSTSRAGAAATAALLGLVASAAAYVTDAAFAASVDELARLARTQAAVLVSGLIG